MGSNFMAPAKKRVREQGTAMNEKDNLVKNLRRLLETEVSQAEVMMAAKGFAQELQEMIEKIGRLQNEDLPPVTDQMRETYGMESSSAFQTQIYGALQGVMDALYTAKGQVDDAVSNMASTGQVDAQTDMDLPVDGMDDTDVDAGMDADLDNLAGDLDAEDEFGAEDGEEPLGRAMKTESLQRKVLEMQKLVEKARKLREATILRENPQRIAELKTRIQQIYDDHAASEFGGNQKRREAEINRLMAEKQALMRGVQQNESKEVDEMFNYKGSGSKSQDTLGNRPAGGVAKYGNEYKQNFTMRKIANKKDARDANKLSRGEAPGKAKTSGENMAQNYYGLSGPRGHLPENAKK
jgi:uncharacterized protein (UPF0335 family)